MSQVLDKNKDFSGLFAKKAAQAENVPAKRTMWNATTAQH